MRTAHFTGCPFSLRPLGRLARRCGRRTCPGSRVPALSAGELAMCLRMGVDPGEYHRVALAEMIGSALRDGRLTPAQKAWAARQTLASLREYLDASARP